MKAFAIYTALRIGLFLVVYAVLAGAYLLISDSSTIPLIWPFLAAVVISALLSIKLLARPRARFAEQVDARARRAASKFEEIRGREDDDGAA